MKDLVKKQIEKISSSPGIYIFKNKSGTILYVGKASNLKSRVSSYFGSSEKDDRPVMSALSQVEKIETKETDSVLEALFLEAELIKKYKPKYNAQGKDDKSFSYIAVTREEFPRIIVLRETDLRKNKTLAPKTYNIETNKLFGPYVSKRQIETALKIIRKIFPFHSRREKSEKGCLESQIGLCPAPHDGKISKEEYGKNIKNITLILKGKKKRLVSQLKREMESLSRKEKFEKAATLRNQIFALEHIQDVALISRERNEKLQILNYKPRTNLKSQIVNSKFRIEAYDISNISGKFAVGSMVVFDEQGPRKDQYRKFKIKTVEGSNDVGMMAEVLFRRFKNSWPRPDLILLDGGRGHVNMAEKILKELSLKIPVVGVAKGPNRKSIKLQKTEAGKYQKSIEEIIKDKTLVKRIMDEAHRFAIQYHKKLRDSSLV